jgi:hypothetical protein
MAIVRLKRNLDLRKQVDQEELLGILSACGTPLDRPVIEYALAHLSDDWFNLTTLGAALQINRRGALYGLPLDTWLKIMDSTYAFRNYAKIDVQIHRLSIPSHEKLDTILVLLVARRFHNRGLRVTFEPNGKGGSDLMVARDADRAYVEVKRENPQEHHRLQRTQQLGTKIIGTLLSRLKEWLVANGMRLEIRFPTLFSDQDAERTANRVEGLVRTARVNQEIALHSKGKPTFLLLPRTASFHYKNGSHMAHVTIEQAGKPVQLFAPENALVRCTFVTKPNLNALKKRIQKASQQLQLDLENDKLAHGLIVTEFLFREPKPAIDAITKRFWPARIEKFLGVTLISPGSTWAIPGAGINEDGMALLRYAGIDPEDETGQPQGPPAKEDMNGAGSDVTVFFTDQ